MDYEKNFKINEEPRIYDDFSDAENPFTIAQEGETSLHYEIRSPIQLTLACCSGTAKEDYVNFYTLSPEKTFYYRQDYAMQSYLYRSQPLHYHDYFELALVLEGSVRHNVESKEYLYQTGSLCLIGRNLHHAEQFLSAGSVLFIGISEQVIKEILSEAQFFFKMESEESRSSLLYRFVHNDLLMAGSRAYLDFIPTIQNPHPYPFLHQICEKLIDAFLNPVFGSTYEIMSLICRLFDKIFDTAYYHCAPIYLNLHADYLIFTRIEHLLQECDGRLSRKELAETLHYSSDYLNRIVKKYTDKSLHDYAMSICMKKAAFLLENTEKSISAIALELHFTNRTYFYQVFQETYGMTPREFRRKTTLCIG